MTSTPLQAGLARRVRIGAMPKEALLARLEDAGILLNDAARQLFADPRFATAAAASFVEAVQVSVAGLGLPTGGVLATLVERAAAFGLLPAPLELGPCLRLQLTEQPEGSVGHAPSQHRAPPGSITVVSVPLAEDDDTPKGFYLRRIDGALWLRGYRSGPEHRWSPQDELVFVRDA